MPSPLLECRAVSCGYAGREVLGNVNLQVESGESVALLGPNGTGKSTLLKTIAKTLAPMSGAIHLSGDPLERLSFGGAARRVAFVPQEEPAHFPFPVREVVALGRIARSTGIFDTEEDQQAATDAMTEADCLHLAARPITELSGGEKQRVLIARALAQQAPLLLLDEPTSHLDVAHQLSVSALVRRRIEQGDGVLTAVHDLNLASSLATRAVLLSGGEVVLDGPVEEVLRSPSLDEVYRVSFQRVEADGRLLVVPIAR